MNIKELISQMTLDEKIGMVHGNALFHTRGVERLNIPPLVMSDGPGGVRHDFPDDSWIPKGTSADFVTYLPSETALASTWNRKLAYSFGDVLGREARGRGKDVILAPGVNLRRSPLCGRNFEYMSEDPVLTAEMAVPLIKGIQQNDVAACVKHYAVNNQEKERMTCNVEVDEDILRSRYLYAFEQCVKQASVYSIMPSYNRIRGVYATSNRHLLKDILRDDWGFDGVTISDWGAVHETEGPALNGLDLEMSVTPDFDDYYFAKPLKEKFLSGEIPEQILDEKIEHILTMMEKLHMLGGRRKAGTYNSIYHHQVMEQVSDEAIVLCKNRKSHLPLSIEHTKTVAVIGDNANRRQCDGGGSSEVKSLYEITPLLGISMFLGGNAKVSYAPGYYVDNEKNVSGEVDWQADSLSAGSEQSSSTQQWAEIIEQRRKYREEAINLARQCDEVIFVGGYNHAYDTEGFDRDNITLPYAQDDLINELLAINPETTIVLIGGSVMDVSAFYDQAHNVLISSYMGMRGGCSLAKVLFGAINPSGHMTETIPLQLSDSPVHKPGQPSLYPGVKRDGDDYLTSTYSERDELGYAYYEKHQIPVAIPFGHGLSYTQFTHTNIVEDREHMQIHVNVANADVRAGSDVIQLYIRKNGLLSLVDFEKVALAPYESKMITFTLAQMDYEEFIIR